MNLKYLQAKTDYLENEIKKLLENLPATLVEIIESQKSKLIGEKGKDGQDGRDGKDGAKGKDGKDGEKGKDGKDGKDGYIPKKGIDYFTDKEIQEIASHASKLIKVSGKKSYKLDENEKLKLAKFVISKIEIKQVSNEEMARGLESLPENQKLDPLKGLKDFKKAVQKVQYMSGGVSKITQGTGGSSIWGGITGTLSDQTDLQNALDEKLDSDTEHNELLSIQGGTTGEYYHLTNVQYTDLTDSTDTTLHYHSSDRNRANHIGTQTSSTISDFDIEVSNNVDVAANTAARHTRSHGMTSIDDHTAGNYKTFYSDGSGQIQELVHGVSGQVLTSNGETSTPSWQTISSGGQILYDATVGSSGADYTTINDAITAGKKRIALITDITETSKITISSDDTLIESFGGRFFTITFANAVTDNLVELSANINRVSIKKMKIVGGTGLATSKAGLRLLGTSTDVFIEDIFVDVTASTNDNACYWIENSSTQNNLIMNRLTGSCVKYGIYTNALTCNNILITNVNFTCSSTTAQGFRWSIATTDNQNFKLENIKITLTSTNASSIRYAMYVVGNSLSTSTNVFNGYIENINLIFTTASSNGAGIYLTNPGVHITNGFIDLNSDSSGDGIYLDNIGVTYPRMIEISNLMIRANKAVNAVSSGVFNISVKNCVHKGNSGFHQLLENGTSGKIIHCENNTSSSGYCGNTFMLYAKNTSGTTLVIGDVVVVNIADPAGGNSAMTTTTTDGSHHMPAVAMESITNNAFGWFIYKGYTRKLNVFANATPNNIGQGTLLQTYTTVKQAYANASPTHPFAMSLTSGITSPTSNLRAVLFGYQT